MWKILTNRCFRPDWPLLFALGWARSVFVWNPQTLSLFLSTSAPMMMITLPRGRHLVKTNNNKAYTKLLVQTNLSDQTGFFFPHHANQKPELNENHAALHVVFISQVPTYVTSALSVHVWWGFTLSPAPKTPPPRRFPWPCLMRSLLSRSDEVETHQPAVWPLTGRWLLLTPEHRCFVLVIFLFPFFFSWKASLLFALCYSISGDGEVVQRWGRRSWLPLHRPGAFLCGVSRFKILYLSYAHSGCAVKWQLTLSLWSSLVSCSPETHTWGHLATVNCP